MQDAGAGDMCTTLNELDAEWLKNTIDRLMEDNIRQRYGEISADFKARECLNKENAAKLLGKQV